MDLCQRPAISILKNLPSKAFRCSRNFQSTIAGQKRQLSALASLHHKQGLNGFPPPLKIKSARSQLLAFHQQRPHQRYNSTTSFNGTSTRAKMKAIQIKGGASKNAEDLFIGEAEQPQLKDGQVLVKVKAFGLNRMDILQRAGNYPLPPGAPTILGVEFSGTVEEEGASGKWKKGDEVFGLAYGGAYAEYIAVDAGMLTSRGHLSWEKAAGVSENFLTAFQCLHLVGDLKPNATVLVHAAASGVGTAMIQIAKHVSSATVIGTVGSSSKVDYIKGLGADLGVNYKDEDFEEKVKEFTNGGGVDLVVDPVGKNYWQKNISLLKRDGVLVCYGTLSGAVIDTPFNMGQILYKRLRIQGTTLRSRSVEYQSELLQRFMKEAYPKISGPNCKGVVLHKTYSWKDIIEATKEMEGGHNSGKIVCVID